MAALMMAIVVGAAGVLFANGSDASVATQRQSQLISVADQQLQQIGEEVKTQGFNKLAMSGAPAPLPVTIPNSSYSSSLPIDPNTFVKSLTGCGSSNEELLIEANFDNTLEGVPLNPYELAKNGISEVGFNPWSGCTDTGLAQVGEPLEILSNGFVTPQQTESVGTDTAVVDTYVTDTYVGCNGSGLGGCPTVSGSGVVSCGSWPSTSASTTCGDARRVIVAVVLDDHGRNNIGPSAPVYQSAIFTNPSPSNAPSSTVGFTVGAKIG
jgi:hypothetical protein